MEANSKTIVVAGKTFELLATPKVDTPDSKVVGMNEEYFLVELVKRDRDKKVVGTARMVFPKTLDILVRDAGSKKAVLKIAFGAAKIATRAQIKEYGKLKYDPADELFE